jgi:hypothetical protein
MMRVDSTFVPPSSAGGMVTGLVGAILAVSPGAWRTSNAVGRDARAGHERLRLRRRLVCA